MMHCKKNQSHKMAPTQILALLFAVVQLGAADQTINYKDCMKDVEGTKKRFETAMSLYWTEIMPPQLKFSDTYKVNLNGMKEDACVEKTMAGKPSKEYVYLGSVPCKVFPLKEDFVAPWTKDESVSDKVACLYMSTKGKIGVMMAKNNLVQIKSCDGVKWFNETYVKSYEQCKKHFWIR